MTVLSAPQRMTLLSIATSIATLSLKFLAYWLTGSVSLLSDAMESFVNLAAAVVALIMVTVAARPADDGHPYGHEKAEYFSSGVEGALIMVAAVLIIYTAIERLLVPQAIEDLGIGLGISVVASGLNWRVATAMLKAGKQHDSITLEADGKHLLTDVWTSMGVVAGLCLLWVLPAGWTWLDPVIAILVALNIIYTGFDLLHRSLDGLMDATLPAAELSVIQATILAELDTGQQYLDLISRKAGAKRFVEFKLRVPGDVTVATAHLICDRIEHAIGAKLNNITTTIHVEPSAGPSSKSAHFN